MGIKNGPESSVTETGTPKAGADKAAEVTSPQGEGETEGADSPLVADPRMNHLERFMVENFAASLVEEG